MQNSQESEPGITLIQEFVSPGPSDPLSVAYTSADSKLVLLFEAGRCSLADEEIAALAQWVKSWNHPGNKKHVTLAGASATPRSSRLQRLNYLTNLILELGVPRSRFHPSDDWIKFVGVSTKQAVPPDMVWLQLRSFPC